MASDLVTSFTPTVDGYSVILSPSSLDVKFASITGITKTRGTVLNFLSNLIVHSVPEEQSIVPNSNLGERLIMLGCSVFS